MPPPLEYEPVRCKAVKCGAVLNPYWYVYRRELSRMRTGRTATRQLSSTAA